ncbi:MAG: metal ABC transporter permease [Verrucomicrobia bacterium]|nr:metal ABC transporter permease [Verrucomicrobiota bacterium]MCH8511250.1 metal ABC transporter permease [Kiritimatiellia bacterium]
MIGEIREMYGYAFMQHALLVGVFGGGLLAFLGVFIHLRRIVFLGAALPQISALGISIALFFSLAPFLGAVVGGVAGILLLSFSGRPGKLPSEGWVGIAYATGGSVAVVLLSLSPNPDAGALRLFTGDILGANRSHALWAIGVALGTGLLFRLCWSKFLVSGFDPVMSATLGLKVHVWNALLFLCLGFGLAAVMNTAGSMLAFGMLIGPPAAALMLFRSFPAVILTAVILGTSAAFLGLTASFWFDLPGGPAMATAALFPVLPARIWVAIRDWR